MFLLPSLIALVFLNFRPCNCQGRLLAVQQDTNIDYLFAIDSSYVFHSSTSGFVQGTAQRPCQPPANCVEFYPEKRSFMIKAESHANYSAVILTPEASDRAQIAIVIVNEGEFFPDLRGVQFIKPVIFKSFNENSFGVILDENVKEFKLMGNISKYGSPSTGTGLEIVIPNERVNEGRLLAVQQDTNIDYLFAIDSSYVFHSSTSGFVQGTAQRPCQPPANCVEFYPEKRSFMIKADSHANYSAVILTPEASDRAPIAIVIVNEGEFFPELRGVQFIKPVIFKSFNENSFGVILDENVKEFKLMGNISKYGSPSTGTGLEIVIPNEGRLLAVQQDTNIDYLFAIDSSYVFHSSTSGFVQGTAQRPCQPPTNCVEFYPEKRSFMIKADSHANYSAVILTPEASDRAQIAIVIVNEGEFFPDLRGVQFIKPVIFKSFNENSFGVILDENVKEFKLMGNISKYGSPSTGTGLEIVIPNERVKFEQHPMFLLPSLTALVFLNFRPCNCQGRLLAVQQDTNIDYLFAIDSSYVFHSSTSGFVQGTAQRPCQPPTNCVEFYPEKRSFMIKADSHANYSAVILTPEASDRAPIAIVIVNEGEFIPDLRGVQFIKPVIFKSFNENSFGVILDENVKEFKLMGNISKYGSPSTGTGLEIVIPNERVNGGQYKIMRVTGLSGVWCAALRVSLPSAACHAAHLSTSYSLSIDANQHCLYSDWLAEGKET
nr:unnamed protein product [Spirometra erinaceieuropaei]